MSFRALFVVTLTCITILPGAAEAARSRQTPRAGADENRRAGEAFLAAHREKEGVVTLASGLQYRVLKAGDGKRPTLADTVVVHYRGTLVNGTEFGSSYKARQPGRFPLRGAIAGWREALQLMPAGSRWQLVVPPHLAYGPAGSGRLVGPDATLVFEVDLVAVVGDPKEAAARRATAIQVSFKVDPRLTRSLYMGDRWVSSQTFSAPPRVSAARVEARARVVDVMGRHVSAAPQWQADDPGMVEVTAAPRGEVAITVKRPGASKLKVVADGVTKELAIVASLQAGGIAVEIAQ